MDTCLFCRIVRGEIPCYKVAESANFLAMLDISPMREGHTLVLPKKHATNLLDMPEYLGNELLEFSQRVAHAAMSAAGAQGFNFGLNNGAAAGQAVFHAHFHVIPRKEGDGLELSFSQRSHGTPATKERLLAMQAKVSGSYK